MHTNYSIRKADREDIPIIIKFIKGIAKYEKMEHEVQKDPLILEEELFDK